MGTKPFFNVSAAIIIDERQNILITRRPLHSHLGGYWEFPGGKIKEGENAEQALKREIIEETGLNICVDKKYREVTFEYDIKIVKLLFFFCRLCPPKQTVKKIEISDFRWVKKFELKKYRFPPADAAIIDDLSKSLS